jgi:two-component system sensor histidine kinase KdpD
MLEQIVYNLLQNAILYTNADCTITVTAISHTNALQLLIEDNGAGFPDDEIKYVFDKFYRLRASKTGGTGLGLSIVKGFTEALGGTVHLKNMATGGACFTITIPAETAYLNKKSDLWLNRKY